MAGKYRDWYAVDLAWREDLRRVAFRKHAKRVLASALAHPISRNMAGYWQHMDKATQPLIGWNPLSGMAAAAAP